MGYSVCAQELSIAMKIHRNPRFRLDKPLKNKKPKKVKRLLPISFIKHQGEHNFLNTVIKFPLLYSQYIMKISSPLLLPPFQRVKKKTLKS